MVDISGLVKPVPFSTLYVGSLKSIFFEFESSFFPFFADGLNADSPKELIFLSDVIIYLCGPYFEFSHINLFQNYNQN